MSYEVKKSQKGTSLRNSIFTLLEKCGPQWELEALKMLWRDVWNHSYQVLRVVTCLLAPLSAGHMTFDTKWWPLASDTTLSPKFGQWQGLHTHGLRTISWLQFQFHNHKEIFGTRILPSSTVTGIYSSTTEEHAKIIMKPHLERFPATIVLDSWASCSKARGDSPTTCPRNPVLSEMLPVPSY